jgi:hypothetical protein
MRNSESRTACRACAAARSQTLQIVITRKNSRDGEANPECETKDMNCKCGGDRIREPKSLRLWNSKAHAIRPACRSLKKTIACSQMFGSSASPPARCDEQSPNSLEMADLVRSAHSSGFTFWTRESAKGNGAGKRTRLSSSSLPSLARNHERRLNPNSVIDRTSNPTI